MKLTAKQRRFVAEYIKCLNGTQAAIAAGYSPKTARSIASENLGKLVIQAEIEQQEKARQAMYVVEQGYLLDQLVKIADYDIVKLFKSDGRMLPPHEWPADANNIVASYKTGPVPRVPERQRYAIEFVDRLKILERIGEIVGAFPPRRTIKRKK